MKVADGGRWAWPLFLTAWLLRKYGTKSLTDRKPRLYTPDRPRNVPNAG
ncbi:hypothetical protein [Paenarthrobacter sp.]|nr:hypothetical protein [Paenarthrobacter sp.]